MNSYGLFTGKSLYIPGSGRLDFSITGTDLTSITFVKGAGYSGDKTTVKFVPVAI
jgi:hypothetical protein